MHEITLEMTQVVSSVQNCVPKAEVISSSDLTEDFESNDNDEDSDDFEDLKLVRSSSAERRLVSGRQYDSTTSEDTNENDENNDGDDDDHVVNSTSDLREDMKAAAKLKDPNVDCAVVRVSQPNRWTGIFGSKNKDNGELRAESLRLEATKLEKELESLSLKQGNEDKEDDITTRLQELSEDMLNVGSESSKHPPSTHSAPLDMSSSRPRKGKTFWKPNENASRLKVPTNNANEVDDFDFIPVEDGIAGDSQILNEEAGEEELEDAEEAPPKTFYGLFKKRRDHHHNKDTATRSPHKGKHESKATPVGQEGGSPTLTMRKKSLLHRHRGSVSPSPMQSPGGERSEHHVVGGVENGESPTHPGRSKSRRAGLLGGAAPKSFLFHRRKHATSSPVTPDGDHGNSFSKSNVRSGASSKRATELSAGSPTAENAFDQIRHRLALRGEKLSTLGTQSENMNSAAQDMAAVAKKLRQQQEKGLFG